MDARYSILRISVVMPARNEEMNISCALDALLVQTVKPYEVLVVDNRSSDGTMRIAERYRKQFRNVRIRYRILQERRVGCALARNRGFFCAASPIIASLDADIVPDRDWIQNILSHFHRYDSVAVSGITVMHDASALVRIISSLNWYKYLTLALRLIFGFQTISTANAGIRADAFRVIHGFDTSYVFPDQLDDTELSGRLSAHGAIRIDTRIRASGSFRRYNTLSGAAYSSLSRLKSWIRISREYRRRKNPPQQFVAQRETTETSAWGIKSENP